MSQTESDIRRCFHPSQKAERPMACGGFVVVEEGQVVLEVV